MSRVALRPRLTFKLTLKGTVCEIPPFSGQILDCSLWFIWRCVCSVHPQCKMQPQVGLSALEIWLCMSPFLVCRWTALCLRAEAWFRDLPSGSLSCSGWIWSLWWSWAGQTTSTWSPISRSLGLGARKDWWLGVSSSQRLCSSILPPCCRCFLQSPFSFCRMPPLEPGDQTHTLSPHWGHSWQPQAVICWFDKLVRFYLSDTGAVPVVCTEELKKKKKFSDSRKNFTQTLILSWTQTTY